MSGSDRRAGACLLVSLILIAGLPSISLAKHTASRIVYGPDHLYVTLKGMREFYVIDRKDFRSVQTVPVKSPPCGGFITKDGRDLYIALGEEDEIAIVDTASNTMRTQIPLKTPGVDYMDPGGMAVSPDGKTVYVANESSNNLSVVDLKTQAIRKNIPLGIGPQDVAMTPDGKTLYVTDFYSIRIVNTLSGEVIGNLKLRDASQDSDRTYVQEDGEEILQGPRDIIMAPDGKSVYAALEDSGEIAVVDTATNRIRNLVDVGAYPGGLAISPDGRFLYVAHRGGEEVSVLDTRKDRVVKKVRVGKGPWDIAVSPDGDKVYVVNQGSSDISIIESGNHTVVTTILLGAIKSIFPRGLRRMFFIPPKRKRRIRKVPFPLAVIAALFLVPFSFTMLDPVEGERNLLRPAVAGVLSGQNNPQVSFPPPKSQIVGSDRKIVFESRRTGNWEIYIMNADGTGQARLTNTRADNRAPFWSLDGQKILFVSDRDGNKEVYLMKPDGSDQKNLTRSAGDDFSPSWSPDGKWIMFVSDRDGLRDVYRMDTSGGRQVRLTTGGHNWNPNWTPDSKQVAFVSSRDGNNEIYLMNADGTEQVNLTRHPAEDGRGSHSWSPDGRKIAWVTNRDRNWEIYVMNA
ncbi:MAG TPA: beta-propeller fold lactonase family protein, partial [Nitrospiria bacterium]